MYKIKFSIGDWSGDGHDRAEDYLVNSSHPVEVVREAYFTAIEKTGLDFGNICSKHEENYIAGEYMDKLKKLKAPLFLLEEGLTPKSFLYLLLWFITLGDEDLFLKIKDPDKDIKDFHFYGFDSKKRHIPSLGYRLFD